MRNLTMLTDLYQLTMMYGYFKSGMRNNMATFDMFYRSKDESTHYAVFAGLEQLIDYLQNLRFEDEALDYLRSLNIFDEDFMQELKNFKFHGDVYAVPEGTIVFSNEPLIRVTAPIFEAQLIETALLNIINHQTLIATKASRVVQAAEDDMVMEFGLRRAQGPDAGIYGARAAIIGGCRSTSNVLTGQMYNIPIAGTHAHSWVMSFPDEITAFRKYAEMFPSSCLLLVDTFDTLRSGVPNAITVFRELREKGYEPKGIRLDSGDLAYLSREARKMLDEAGFPDTVICASGDLDENLIRDLKLQGACINTWGVGTKLITSEDCPSLGGVYKMSAEYEDGRVVPKIKISENPVKITNPGEKKLWRIYDKDSGKAVADLISLSHETYDESKPLTIYDPINTWKSMTLTNYTMKDLHVQIFNKGECVYESPSLAEIQKHCAEEMDTFWEQYKRLLNPHRYKVDLSDSLWMLKNSMLQGYRRG
ncbi:MAG: nicotinate phosphoribosyltransferase [Clostridia bacterium]|nr:nicotinate phosphoribosyltransferase [Clostridia bacterium]MBP3653735.1 nicotinate phosphoribosyltransferase [Clostridia bacterium]MBP3653736.1 nicotinate phosphoribosyltransferase [Clostridia bacterium]